MFKFTIEFDTTQLENQLSTLFGKGSDAQYTWSKIVFDGSVPYMPMLNAMLIDNSMAASEQTMADGYLIYPGVYAHFLWEGLLYIDPDTGSAWARLGVTKERTETPLEYTLDHNPLAGARWVERAAADNLPKWIAEMQRHSDAGFPMGA
jgi:hypothetical protein